MSATSDQQLSRGALVALIVGSMVGAGIFTLPSAFGRATGVLSALIAGCIAEAAGTRMMCDAALMQQKRAFRATLGATHNFSIAADGALFLQTSDGRTLNARRR